MNSLTTSRVIYLSILLLFCLPFSGLAQLNSKVDYNPRIGTTANEIIRVAPDNMPIFNPKSDAAIMIKYPPENLSYNMPNAFKEDNLRDSFDLNYLLELKEKE